MRAGLRRYGALLALPGARGPVIASALGAMPIGMFGLAILLLARETTGSFGTAGRIVGAFGLANALGAVAQGRLMDRLGQTTVLRLAAGVRVLGVSPDPVKSVKKFHDKQALNFTLLADEDHAVCEAYGVWTEKSMYGRKYWGAQRTTFVIDAEGTVVHVIEKVTPKSHDDEVLAALAA